MFIVTEDGSKGFKWEDDMIVTLGVNKVKFFTRDGLKQHWLIEFVNSDTARRYWIIMHEWYNRGEPIFKLRNKDLKHERNN